MLCLLMTEKAAEELRRTRPLLIRNGEFVSEILWSKEKGKGRIQLVMALHFLKTL